MEDIEQSVLLTIFTSNRKRYKVFFHQSKIIWDNEKPPFGMYSYRQSGIYNIEKLFKSTCVKLLVLCGDCVILQKLV